ncbi:MAG: DNA-processing protein DprA, partial [candidate division Zixibacteria bacterium]|nr:DNA-processing protein DprA [candidate division Zixibacteria bacterium]
MPVKYVIADGNSSGVEYFIRDFGVSSVWLTTAEVCIDYNMISENKYDMTTRVLALYRFAGVTPRMFQALMQHFGNLDRIERADSGSLMAVEGMATKAANRITKATQSLQEAADYKRSLKERDILVVSRFDDSYPHRLEELNDPPPILFARGSLPEASKPIVALVGADEASNEGIKFTVEVAEIFVEADVQLVASLSKGIDAAAHLAC